MEQAKPLQIANGLRAGGVLTNRLNTRYIIEVGHSWLVAFALLIWSPALPAQDSASAQQSQPSQSKSGSGSTRNLPPLELEDRWTTALVNRDPHTFDLLLAPGFVYTENASIMTRSDVIKSVTGSDVVDWARNEGMKLHDFGNVQVITGILHLRGHSADGKRFDKRYQFTDTWRRRHGRWQIIAAQDYLIPQ